MKIHNVDDRELPAAPDHVGALINTLASRDV
jgi:pyrimidine operon attenuation protein/uracil phosphoribosyltransferase